MQISFFVLVLNFFHHESDLEMFKQGLSNFLLVEYGNALCIM
jgi:hypothetical protein